MMDADATSVNLHLPSLFTEVTMSPQIYCGLVKDPSWRGLSFDGSDRAMLHVAHATTARLLTNSILRQPARMSGRR